MGAGLPEPDLDYDVVAPDGAFVACLDLAYPRSRVGIEYDGAGHRTQAQFERDIAKIEWLRDLGWDIVRFTAADFRVPLRMSRIVPRVRAAIARQESRKG